MDIDPTNSSIDVDTLFFSTRTNTQNIQIGGNLNTADTLDITAAEFGALRPLNNGRFSSLTVNSRNGTLTIGTIPGPVRAQQLMLSGDGVNILAAPGSLVTDKLTIQTNSLDQDLLLNAPSLEAFQPLDDSGSFSTLDFSIGSSLSSTSSGVLTIQAPIPPTRDSVTLMGGDINLSGSINAVKDLMLTANNDIDVSSGAISSVESLTLTANNDIDVSSGTINSVESLRLTASNNINISATPTSSITTVNLQADNITIGGSLGTISNLLTLAANELAIESGPESITTDQVTIQTRNLGQNLLVGEAIVDQPDTLELSSNELRAFTPQNGSSFEALTFSVGGTVTIESPLPTSSNVINFTGNEFDLLAGNGSIDAESVSFKASGGDRDIIVGGSDDAGDTTIDLTTTDLDAITFLDQSDNAAPPTLGISAEGTGNISILDPFERDIALDFDTEDGSILVEQPLNGFAAIDFTAFTGGIEVQDISNSANVSLITGQRRNPITDGITISLVPGGDDIRVGKITGVETVTLNVAGGTGTIEVERIRSQENINLSTAEGNITATRLRTPGSVNIDISGGSGAVNVNQIPKAALVSIETNDGTVTVPNAIDGADAIDITTNQGSIVLTDVSNANSVNLETSGGSITADEIMEVGTASLSVSAGTGTVDVRRIRSTGNVSLQTNQGNIDVSRIRTPGTVDIDVDSGAGNVDVNRIQNANVVAIETEEGAIVTDTIRNAEDVNLSSGQGSITIGEIDTIRTGRIDLSAGDTITVENDIKKAGTVTVQGSEIDFLGGRNSIGRSGTVITIQATQDIEIGRTSNSDIFNLGNRDTNAINTNVSGIRFEALNGSDIEILAQDNPLTFDVPVVFQADSGDIRLNRAIEFEDRATFEVANNSGRILVGADLTFRGDSSWNARARVTDDVTIRSDNSLIFNDAIIGNDNSELSIISPRGLNTERIKIDGDLSLTSRRGDISTGNLTSDDGSINVLSRNNLSTRDINAMGDITLESRSGSIETRNLSSSGTDLQLTTPSTLSIREINTEGTDVTLTAGSIPSLGDLRTAGGDILIDVTSPAALDLPTLDTSQSDLETTSRRGIRNTDDAESVGDVEVTISGALTVDAIATGGGSITLDSQTSIQATQLDSSSESGSGGAIALNAPTVDVGAIDSSGATNGGSINIPPNEGELLTTIQTGPINSSSGGNGGDIRIAATEILQTDTIDASAGTGTGGNVSLELTVGDLDTPELEDLTGNFQVASIDTRSTSGNGGGITVDTNILFRTTNTIDGTTSSINATGGNDNGDIEIDHGGGPQDITFDVLAPATPLTDLINGTTGSIVSGGDQITPPENIAGSITVGNVRVGTQPPLNVCDFSDCPTSSPEPPSLAGDYISLLEEGFTKEYADYFGLDDVPIKTVEDARGELAKIQEDTRAVDPQMGRSDSSVRPALIYAFFDRSQTISNTPTSEALTENVDWYFSSELMSSDSSSVDQLPWFDPSITKIPNKSLLHVVMVTADREPVVRRTDITYLEITSTVESIRDNLQQGSVPKSTISISENEVLRNLGTRLFCQLLDPVRSELNKQDINNLAFIMDQGLRSLPISALYMPSDCEQLQHEDGQYKEYDGQYLIEEYSVGILPSLSLVEAIYDASTLEDADPLAMGASEFDDSPDLNAVPKELEIITRILPPDNLFVELQTDGFFFLNKDFTQANLETSLESALEIGDPFEIVHFATHSDFNTQELSDSYIHLGDKPLLINEVQNLNWDDADIKLMVLSACNTAIGSRDAELGFAGIAAQTGVRSVLASLWRVHDIATLAVMAEFYYALKRITETDPSERLIGQPKGIRAEALRQAQIAMLEGKVKLSGGILTLSNGETINLSEDKEFDLSSPSHWAAFTMISSLW